MTDNLPILYQNILFALPSDHARKVFLWAVERPGEDRMCYRAERFAREADRMRRTASALIDLGQTCRLRTAAKGVPTRLLCADQRSDLIQFVLNRHANWRYGGNVRLPESLFPEGGAA